MSRASWLALPLVVLAVAVAGCHNSNSPSAAAAPKFTATLLPGNEAPNPTTNADASGSGTATITLNTTKDASGNITAASADMAVTLTGFPAGTTLTGAHIHTGGSGVAGGIVVNTGLTSGEIVLPAGSGSFTKSASVDPALAQQIIASPAAYYFNVHTTINTGGAARGQLVRAN